MSGLVRDKKRTAFIVMGLVIVLMVGAALGDVFPYEGAGLSRLNLVWTLPLALSRISNNRRSWL
jgi:hypothetical protein